MDKQLYLVTCRGYEYLLFLTSDYNTAREISDIHNNTDPYYEMSISIIDCIGGIIIPYETDLDIFKPSKVIYDDIKDIREEINSYSGDLNIYYFQLKLKKYSDVVLYGEGYDDLLFFDEICNKSKDIKDNFHTIISIGTNRKDAAKRLDPNISWRKWKYSYNIKRLKNNFSYFIWSHEEEGYIYESKHPIYDFDIDF